MGKRTLKFKDFGINAATFLNMETGDSYRIISTETSRKLADSYAPEEAYAIRRQLAGYQRMPDEELFAVQPVKVSMNEWEMPGPARIKAICRICGQVIRDGREIIKESHILCRPCAGMAYFLLTESENINATLIRQENIL
jgi:formylmethanofuran dehydrogenase subunit E